jgi:hypothetical protein
MYDTLLEEHIVKETIALRDWKLENFSLEIKGICSLAEKVLLTGSKYIVNDPAYLYNDIDIMLYISSEKFNNTVNSLFEAGFEDCGDGRQYEGTDLYILRKGEYNLLVTDTKSYFDKWVLATEVATISKLTRKEDRVRVFKLIINDIEII